MCIICGKSNPISVHSITAFGYVWLAHSRSNNCNHKPHMVCGTTHPVTQGVTFRYFSIFSGILWVTKYLIWFNEWIYLRVTAVATASTTTTTITIAIMLRATASAATSTARTTQHNNHTIGLCSHVKLYEPNTYVTQSAAIPSIHFIILRWWILKRVRTGFHFFPAAAIRT